MLASNEAMAVSINYSFFMFQEAEALFNSIESLKLGGSYLPHLAAMLTKIGPEASSFLAALFGQPEGTVSFKKQVGNCPLPEWISRLQQPIAGHYPLQTILDLRTTLFLVARNQGTTPLASCHEIRSASTTPGSTPTLAPPSPPGRVSSGLWVMLSLQVTSLELFAVAVGSGLADAQVHDLVPCLLAAMCQPAQDVRTAALPAAKAMAEVCPKGDPDQNTLHLPVQIHNLQMKGVRMASGD